MPRTSKVRGDFFCSELEEVQADILCEAAADLAFYEVHDQLAGGADDGGVKVSRVALFVRGAADDGVQVEVGRAVLAGERTGEGAELVVYAVVALFEVLLRPRIEHAEGHVIARADAAHRRRADILPLRELEELGADLLAPLEPDDQLASETSVFHEKVSFFLVKSICSCSRGRRRNHRR